MHRCADRRPTVWQVSGALSAALGNGTQLFLLDYCDYLFHRGCIPLILIMLLCPAVSTCRSSFRVTTHPTGALAQVHAPGQALRRPLMLLSAPLHRWAPHFAATKSALSPRRWWFVCASQAGLCCAQCPPCRRRVRPRRRRCSARSAHRGAGALPQLEASAGACCARARRVLVQRAAPAPHSRAESPS